jgi:hypothetical protein
LNNEADKIPRKTGAPADRFGAAGFLVAFIGIFSFFCILSIAVGSIRLYEIDLTKKLAGELNLSDLSVVPSGRAPRGPETISYSTNENFYPLVPVESMDVKYLIIRPAPMAERYDSP